MKTKLTAMLLGLATSGLVSFAQDNNAPSTPPPAPPPESAPVNVVDVGAPAAPDAAPAETPAAAPAETPAAAPAETPAGAPAAAGTNAPAAKAEEVVPLQDLRWAAVDLQAMS